ncbi:DUF3987 domain-containing protein [Ralstonia pickettii]|uniref:DUF3987 domain-containing protein n=1 Tax=Ralstonia pickettii TaxID=329 RepID=UPI0015B9961F|nr:DUF3987 domain-containing protein [Ralstonia pickettii]NWK43319.1 DUF3987 domain-containing protein [Ralstonia pickettii]
MLNPNYGIASVDPEWFPAEAFGPAMGSKYAALVQMNVAPPVAGVTVLHAGIAYANPVVDLESESGKVGPIGLYTMVSGESGCGKTVAKDYAYELMLRFHAAYLKGDPDEIAAYEDAGQPASVDEEDDEDAASFTQEKSPGKKRQPSPYESYIQFSGTTEALLADLAVNPIANGIDDEFTARQSGSVTRHGNTRVKLIDGQTFSVALKTSGRLNIIDPRVTYLTLTQPSIRRAFDKKCGEQYRTSGLGPREQFVEYEGGPRAIRLGKHDTPLWNTACMGFLRETARLFRTGQKRRAVKLGGDGLRAWEGVQDRYQQRGRPHGDLALLPEHAARQPEIIQRIAAGMHAFEGWSGDVSADTVERAAVIGDFLTGHYKARFMPKPQVPREHTEASHLEQCLRYYVQQYGQLAVKRNDLREYAANLGMTKAAVERALTVLCSSDRARIVIGPDKAAWVALNPAYFQVLRHLIAY